ncbi:MAG: M20/M25/M40 family metallo-hydrolase [Actinomycetota bacterium]|nr:M20/M25/M40 family metallo-hydrolase [Actinomycetota bacterium]
MERLQLRDEAVRLLQELIRLDTVNPPGNETPAAELLRDYLEPHGVRCDLYARVPERANLVARIPGRGRRPRLLLLSHTDTVLADPHEWSVDPWSGELHDGHVWGRGALDMKGQVAASAVAMASLAREGFEPAGDLVFVAAADEEVGEDPQYGLPWLCEHHPEAVEAEYAINEGAGDRVEVGDRVVYLCSTAEKRSSPLRLVVHGRSGHGSKPGIADNALVKAAPLIERLGAFKPEPVLGPESERFLEVLLGEVPPPHEALDRAREISPFAAETLEPLLSLTFSPTMIEASRKRNVIPGRCEITVDTRLLPGQSEDDAAAIVRRVLGPGEYDLEWGQAYGGTRSPLDPVFWEAVRTFVRRLEPGADVAPIAVAGFTDSHWVRQRFGTVAYGFFPLRTMAPELADRLIHSADERIAVDDLELGVRFLRQLARAVGAPAGSDPLEGG